MNTKATPTREQLNAMLQSAALPDEKGWALYRFLKDNVGPRLLSAEARTLLLEYARLQAPRPSLLHSLMLGIALKMAAEYADFKLPAFVSIWGIANLRPDDYKRTADQATGRTFHSLAERLAAALLRYSILHPAEAIAPEVMSMAEQQGQSLGFLPARPVAATKTFESVHEGRKVRMVKLIGPGGEEYSADWHAFRAKPWEIAGRIYEVLPRRSEKTGNVRIDTIGPSAKKADEVFGRVIGYVDRYDEKHRHYHIYDAQSRHFVAEAPAVRILAGGYAWFAPVVPAQDKFKSAIVLAAESKEAGRQAFGPQKGRVEYVNAEKGYFAYTLQGSTERAFANLKAASRPVAPGDELSLIIYLRRGSDGQKRPYVAEAY